MATEFKLPELGENITGGDVVRVLVKVGQTIKADQAVLEMETGKATVEIPSTVSGVIKEILVKEGTKAKVGQVILTVDGAAAAPAAAASVEPPKQHAHAAAPAPAPATSQEPAAPPAAKIAPPPPPSAAPVAAPAAAGTRGAVAASPSTRTFSREIGVDIAQVAGSGPGGRVSETDVKAFARSAMSGAASRGPAAPSVPPLPDFSKFGLTARQPMNNIRVAAANHLSSSWTTIPHVTIHEKVDITDLEALRKQSKSKADAAGAKLTLTPFLIKIAASALKANPKFNSSVDMAAQEIVQKSYVHIGVAVDTERGLVVPVVRDADKKNVIQIAAELTQIGERARARKISPDEMSGGCFTITNIGGIAGGFFTPIVNYPEVAILGIGRSTLEPVMVNGFFQPRLMLPLSLSFDHRVIDGADGARFVRWIMDAIQQPALLALEG